MIELKKDDWIIATKPIMKLQQGSGFSFMDGYVKIPDEKYMRRPVQVQAVTEQHIVITWPSRLSSGKNPVEIITISEVEERGMIIAAPELVAVAADLF